MISNLRTGLTRQLRCFFSKKTQPFSKIVKPSKTKEELQNERVLAMKEREAFTKWLEEHGNQPPFYMGLFFSAASLPLFLHTYGLMYTPYDDPMFMEYFHRASAFMVGQSFLFVALFLPRILPCHTSRGRISTSAT